MSVVEEFNMLKLCIMLFCLDSLQCISYLVSALGLIHVHLLLFFFLNNVLTRYTLCSPQNCTHMSPRSFRVSSLKCPAHWLRYVVLIPIFDWTLLLLSCMLLGFLSNMLGCLLKIFRLFHLLVGVYVCINLSVIWWYNTWCKIAFSTDRYGTMWPSSSTIQSSFFFIFLLCQFPVSLVKDS